MSMSLQVALTKKLPGFTLEVAFSCEAGKLLAVVGPSGAGKTTIVRCLAGLEQPDAGSIILHGRNWLDTKTRQLLPARRREVGYVFQEHSLFPHLTIGKNVAFAARDTRKVEEYLDLFGLGPLRDRKVRQVSGGERQRAALAQALAREPRVLLLDEPFSALDVVTRTRLRQLLRDLKERLQIPIIHVTHDLEEASFLADRLLPVEQGAVAHDWLRRLPSSFSPSESPLLALASTAA
jgi:molybdate transport system ATP-binding protein